jgi:transcriptional regulator with XRE-family HTH domain
MPPREVKMLNIYYVRKFLSDKRLAVVAERTGIHENTLRRVRDGVVKPSYETLEKISAYMRADND